MEIYPAAEITDYMYKEVSSPLLFNYFYLLTLKVLVTVLTYC